MDLFIYPKAFLNLALSRQEKRSGVYFIFDQSAQLIYIGKAANLYHRLQTHFFGTGTSGHLQDFQHLFFSFSFIPCKDPAKLEAQLIKKYMPRLNGKKERQPIFTEEDLAAWQNFKGLG